MVTITKFSLIYIQMEHFSDVKFENWNGPGFQNSPPFFFFFRLYLLRNRIYQKIMLILQTVWNWNIIWPYCGR